MQAVEPSVGSHPRLPLAKYQHHSCIGMWVGIELSPKSPILTSGDGPSMPETSTFAGFRSAVLSISGM